MIDEAAAQRRADAGRSGRRGRRQSPGPGRFAVWSACPPPRRSRLALDIPLVAINHLQAHIYACRMADGRRCFPASGWSSAAGTRACIAALGRLDFTPLGGTIDDAAGEAFDKVADMLGLPYPGGPAIERAASEGNAQRLRLSAVACCDEDRARLQLQRPEDRGALPDRRARRCQSIRSSLDAANGRRIWRPAFKQAVIDCLVGKVAAGDSGKRARHALCVAGGVAANRAFREQMEAACRKRRSPCTFRRRSYAPTTPSWARSPSSG